MKGEQSGYYGSDCTFYVTNAKTNEIVPDMLILDPMSDPAVVDIISNCGLTDWANKLRRKWADIQRGEKGVDSGLEIGDDE